MYVIFDTETTGVPRDYSAPASDFRNWPRLVELAWILCDDAGEEASATALIVKPRGFVIPKDAAAVHGITTERASREGVELEVVLEAFAKDVSRASVLVAHNMRFDEGVVGAEFLRSGRPNCLAEKDRVCTMVSSAAYCGIPGPYGYKWPSLPELYEKLFRQRFPQAHRALEDVRACKECYFELKRLRVVR